MSISLSDWLGESAVKEAEDSIYRALVEVLDVPEKMRKGKIADITGHAICCLRKGDVLTVSLQLAHVLEKKGIGRIIKELV